MVHCYRNDLWFIYLLSKFLLFLEGFRVLSVNVKEPQIFKIKKSFIDFIFILSESSIWINFI
jgi:hypothetical protein